MAEPLKCVIVQPAAPLPKGFQDFWAEAASVASPKLLGSGGHFHCPGSHGGLILAHVPGVALLSASAQP